MKALVRTGAGAGQFTFCEVPAPEIGEHEALIRVKAVGVCGTDYHIYTGHVNTNIPVIVGHEFCGVVEAVGGGVTEAAPGDKVVSRLNLGVCGVCRPCLTGNPHMCVHRSCPGFKRDGAYAEYIAIDSKMLVPLAEHVSFEEGAVIEPMAIVAHALLERARVEPEDTVVIFGPGPIGLIALQMARLAGAAKIIVAGTDVDEKQRLPLAKQLGADAAVNVQREALEEIVMEQTGGAGADLVVEASGAEPAVNSGISVLRRQGRMCVLGLPTKEASNVRWLAAAEKSLQVIFNYSSSPWSWNLVTSMVGRGAVDVKSLITHRRDLRDFAEMFEEIRRGNVIKGVFLP